MRRSTRRLTLFIAIALGCAQAAAAQERCEIERRLAPDYGGVTLGMSSAELLKKFPAARELAAAPAAADGEFDASLGALELHREKESFEGVEELRLKFAGGRVRRLDVFFRAPAPWQDVTEMAEQMSRRLALPPAWGQLLGDTGRRFRVMECRGFAVVARMGRGGDGSLTIEETAPAGGGRESAPRRPARVKQ
jgi:hypothetical protein